MAKRAYVSKPTFVFALKKIPFAVLFTYVCNKKSLLLLSVNDNIMELYLLKLNYNYNSSLFQNKLMFDDAGLRVTIILQKHFPAVHFPGDRAVDE